MKKYLLSLALMLFIGASVNAQFDLDKLYGGINIGYANPIGDFSEYAKGGLTYNAQAGYYLTDNVGVGFEYAAALTASFDESGDTGLFGLNIFGLNGYYAKGWYKFMDGFFKPYVAVGLGLSQFSEPDLTIGTESVTGASRFGFGANGELGLVLGGFNLSYAFVYGGKTAKEPVFNEEVVDLNILYHKFSVGYIYNF